MYHVPNVNTWSNPIKHFVFLKVKKFNNQTKSIYA